MKKWKTLSCEFMNILEIMIFSSPSLHLWLVKYAFLKFTYRKIKYYHTATFQLCATLEITFANVTKRESMAFCKRPANHQLIPIIIVINLCDDIFPKHTENSLRGYKKI